MNFHRCLCLILLLWIAPAIATAEEQTVYFAVFADGQKIGHASFTRMANENQVRTTETMELTIARGDMAMTIRQNETSIETPQGKPLGFETREELGAMVKTTKGTVGPDGKVQVVTENFGQEQSQTLDWPEGALMSEAMRLLQQEKGLKKGTQYRLNAFAPSLLQALPIHVIVGDRKEVDVLGRIITLTEVTGSMTMPGGPGQIVTTSYLDDELIPQRTIIPIMGMTLELVACDKAFALSPDDIVDFLDKVILPSPAPLEGIVSARSATYVLRSKDDKPLEDWLSTDSQTVEVAKDGAILVTVNPTQAPAGVRFPYSGSDAEALKALQPNRYVQSEHKSVTALARQAVGNATDAAEAARRIETFVGEYITEKNLSVGYATAVEVAASRQGDCSEHAVLTAAMCRAVGIPARMVTGYLYVPEWGHYQHVFGGHAWTEAYIGGKWIGLDATGDSRSVGVGHLAESVGNGEPVDFFHMVTTMGRFNIAEVRLKQ